MDKKKLKIRDFLLLLVTVFLTTHCYSQELLTKELKWVPYDSISPLVFQDTIQIKKWGKSFGPFASVQSKKINIKDNDFIILMVDICSGVYCLYIYIFEKNNKFWQLITNTNTKLTEQLEIKIDSKQEKIIFETKSRQIGELPFEKLSLSSDKTEQ
jgi:hypothetical protein